MTTKKITPHKLLWCDMEMTGLDPAVDRIVEVAAIVTDWNLNEIATFESAVGQDKSEVKSLVDANSWYEERPSLKKEIMQLAEEGPVETEVEDALLALIDQHFSDPEPVLLAGNSIHQDRRFIRQWWPRLETKLHYRMLDVSAWKVVMMGKYGLEFPKSEAHRALGDIRESIDELEFYLEHCKI